MVEPQLHLVAAPDGTQLASWDLGGAGPALLLLHGNGFHGLAFAPLAARLRPHFCCYSYDFRGHGASPLGSGEPPGGQAPAAARSTPAPPFWERFVGDTLAVVEALCLRGVCGAHVQACVHALGPGLC